MRRSTCAALAALAILLLALPPRQAEAQGGTTPQVCVVNRIEGGNLARVTTTYRAPEGQRLAAFVQTLTKDQRVCFRQSGFHVVFDWELQVNGQWRRVCTSPVPSISGPDRDRVASIQGNPASPSCSVGWQ